MCETVHNRKDSTVFEGRVDDILHDCFRLAVDTKYSYMRQSLRFCLKYPAPMMAPYGLPAGGLIKYQYFAISDQGSCKTQQLPLAC